MKAHPAKAVLISQILLVLLVVSIAVAGLSCAVAAAMPHQDNEPAMCLNDIPSGVSNACVEVSP